MIFFTVLFSVRTTLAQSVGKVELLNSQNAVVNTFTTIQACANVIVAGQTCLVYPGTYAERVWILNKTGTEQQKITFKSATQQEAFVSSGFGLRTSKYIVIDGFKITSDLRGWDERQGIYVRSSDCDHLTLINNYIYDIKAGDAIEGGPYCIISNNTMYKVAAGIVANTGCVVENNKVERLYDWLMDGYYHVDNDYSRFFGDSVTFRGNYYYGTDRSETGTSHVDCLQTFDTNGTTGTNLLFENNICFVFSQAMMLEGTVLHQNQNYTIRNNIFAHGGAWGIRAKEIYNLNIYNNIFYDITYGAASLADGSTGSVYNNIFHTIGAASTNTTDYNLFYNSGRLPSVVGTHDILDTDPLLADVLNNNFNLLPGSPAIDAGKNLAGIVDTDINGNSRPRGSGWDIGAYEYASPPDTTPPSAPTGLVVQ